jgi:hypothetical protein
MIKKIAKKKPAKKTAPKKPASEKKLKAAGSHPAKRAVAKVLKKFNDLGASYIPTAKVIAKDALYKTTSQVAQEIEDSIKKTAVALAEDNVAGDLLSRIKSDAAPSTPADKLDKIKSLAKTLRDIEFEIADKEAAVKELKARLNNLSMKELPELFAEYKVPGIKLDAEGNMPACTVDVVPFYKAALPKEDIGGLDWLETNGNGDLIKRVFTVQLPMDSEQTAGRLRAGLQKLKLEYDEKRTVPWTTLTAFVKEQFESPRGRKDLPLEKLGAFVGKIARVKEDKKK